MVKTPYLSAFRSPDLPKPTKKTRFLLISAVKRRLFTLRVHFWTFLQNLCADPMFPGGFWPLRSRKYEKWPLFSPQNKIPRRVNTPAKSANPPTSAPFCAHNGGQCAHADISGPDGVHLQRRPRGVFGVGPYAWFAL